jgi:hypothetical protein
LDGLVFRLVPENFVDDVMIEFIVYGTLSPIDGVGELRKKRD